LQLGLVVFQFNTFEGLFGDQVLAEQFGIAFVLRFGVLQRHFFHLKIAPGLGQFSRSGIRRNLNHQIAFLNFIADFYMTFDDDSGDFGFDLNLIFRGNRADRQSFFDYR